MIVLGRVMLIPYFTAYLIYYFYNLKAKCDLKNDLQNQIAYPQKHILKEEKQTFLCVLKVKF